MLKETRTPCGVDMQAPSNMFFSLSFQRIPTLLGPFQDTLGILYIARDIGLSLGVSGHHHFNNTTHVSHIDCDQSGQQMSIQRFSTDLIMSFIYPPLESSPLSASNASPFSKHLPMAYKGCLTTHAAALSRDKTSSQSIIQHAISLPWLLSGIYVIIIPLRSSVCRFLNCRSSLHGSLVFLFRLTACLVIMNS